MNLSNLTYFFVLSPTSILSPALGSKINKCSVENMLILVIHFIDWFVLLTNDGRSLSAVSSVLMLDDIVAHLLDISGFPV